MNTAVSAAVQAVRGRGRGTLTRGAFVGAAAAPGYIAPGTVQPVGDQPPFLEEWRLLYFLGLYMVSGNMTRV